MHTTRPRIRRFLFVLAALALGLASWLAWPRLWISPPQPAATSGGPRWPFPGVRLLNSEELKAANALSKVIGKKAVNLPKIEAWIRALRLTGKPTLTRAEFEEWMEGETAKTTPSLADFEAWAAAEEARRRTIFTLAEFQGLDAGREGPEQGPHPRRARRLDAGGGSQEEDLDPRGIRRLAPGPEGRP